MPVPKNTATDEKPTETDAEPVEGQLEEAHATYELSNEPHDFDIRRAALELAIAAREPLPVAAARGYYGFLAGDETAKAV